jgi:DMSO/TMAO reductase YedYZ molybdopterin-dependent catalytic subunit
MTPSRARAERKARQAGYDPGRLPPGQYLTDKWPVLHVGAVPRIDLATWELVVEGEVERPLRLRWQDLLALPATEARVDIHCVTRWSRLDVRFRGVHWRELAALARPSPSARFVLARAEQGYTANLPLAALETDDALLAYEAEGAPLAPEHGWPLRLVVPSRYFWKSVKWLRSLELRSSDEPGFWERHGYHNEADPWREERYGF